MSAARTRLGTEPFRFDAVLNDPAGPQHAVNGPRTLCGLDASGMRRAGKPWSLHDGGACTACHSGFARDVLGASWMPRVNDADSKEQRLGLEVLALGKAAIRKPVMGEVVGLRLQAGNALAALVVSVFDRPQDAGGFFRRSRLLWPLDARCGVDAKDPAPFHFAEPLTAPVVVDKEVWTLGCAFSVGQPVTAHPLLRKRVVLRNAATGRYHDARSPDEVTVHEAGDVVGEHSIDFLRGLDGRLRRLFE